MKKNTLFALSLWMTAPYIAFGAEPANPPQLPALPGGEPVSEGGDQEASLPAQAPVGDDLGATPGADLPSGGEFSPLPAEDSQGPQNLGGGSDPFSALPGSEITSPELSKGGDKQAGDEVNMPDTINQLADALDRLKISLSGKSEPQAEGKNS